MLLRYFVNFYDMEIIEEEAFLYWKEDVNQEYPGKGKALFQVCQFIALHFNYGGQFSILVCGWPEHFHCAKSGIKEVPQKKEASIVTEFLVISFISYSLTTVLCYNYFFYTSILVGLTMFVLQVNQWLTWLETAEEEESEEEDY